MTKEELITQNQVLEGLLHVALARIAELETQIKSNSSKLADRTSTK